MQGDLFTIRCPHCDRPPGNETAMVLAGTADAASWTCGACGETFDRPAIVRTDPEGAT